MGNEIVGAETASKLLESMRELVQLARNKAARDTDLGMLPSPLVALLSRLACSEGCRPSAVAEYLRVSPSALSRQLAQAESLGYVVRFPDPDDRRASLLSLAESGVQALQAHRAVQLGWVLSAVADWTEDEVQELTSRLDRLSDAVQAQFEAHKSNALQPDRSTVPEVCSMSQHPT